MTQKELPTEDQMLQLKKELNHLLWTENVPELQPELSMLLSPDTQIERSGANIQCVAHAVLACGIFLNRGFRVTTRGGRAFIIESFPDGNRNTDRLEEIVKHWWVTLDDYGLVDLSLKGENEDPLIYRNRSSANRWHIVFGQDQQKLARFIRTRQQGCFYWTVAKRSATATDLAQALTQEFPPARERGISLTYANLLWHAEGLLAGTKQSLIGESQSLAWERLAGFDVSRSPQT